MHFEPNQGQLDSRVRFQARSREYSVSLTDEGVVLGLQRQRAVARGPDDGAANASPMAPIAVTIAPAGGTVHHAPQIDPVNQLPSVSHYYRGVENPLKFENIPHYQRVIYRNVYPGIDLAYYGRDGRLEYDYIVSPGVDPGAIRMRFNGLESIRLSESGDLLLDLGEGDVLEHKAPVIFQEGKAGRDYVGGRYTMLADNEVGFALDAYDTTRELVIDPVLVYSGYLGGSAADRADNVTTDSTGNVYVVGTTSSPNFPLASQVPTNSDVSISKFDANGQLLASALFDRSSTSNSAAAIAVAADGSIAFGATLTGFIPSSPYVTKLAPDLTQLWTVVLANSDPRNITAIGMTSTGKVWAAGNFGTFFGGGGFTPTGGPLQPTYGGGDYDLFISRISAACVIEYATYFGGNGRDFASHFSVNAADEVLVTGLTASSNLVTTTGPSYPGSETGFPAKLTASGGLAWSTYIAGNATTSTGAIASDGAGGAWVAGRTAATNIATAGAYDTSLSTADDAYLIRLNIAGVKTYGTYLGGSGDDGARALAVDGANGVWITGTTTSTDFPVTADAYSTTPNGTDIFVTRLISGLTLSYSTLIGGAGTDQPRGIGIGANDSAWVVGATDSTNFPVVGGGLASNVVGTTGDGFVFSIAGTSAPSIQSPVTGSTLPGSSASFTWIDGGSGASEYWLYIGSTTGASNYLDSGALGAATSLVVNGLPTNGSVVHARLWYRLPGDATWYSTDSSFSAATGGALSLTSPTPGSTLTASSASFSWTDSGLGITKYWLYAGSTVGGAEYFSSGDIGTATSAIAANLPVDGSSIKVRLWYQTGGGATWFSTDAAYTAATLATPAITSPAAGAILPGGSQAFQWTDNGTGPLEYWLYAGSTPGGAQYFNQSLGSATTATVTGLPASGETLNMRLWYKAPTASVWSFKDSTYLLADDGPRVTAPTPGASLTGASQTFNWTAGNAAVQEWWIYAGSGAGVGNYFDSGSLGSATSGTVSGLPADGSIVYVTLWYRTGSLWQFSSFPYTSNP